MSLEIAAGKVRIMVEAIEYRPDDGLLLRTHSEPSEMDMRSLSDALCEVLRASPYAIFRVCCDSVPPAAHVGSCKGRAG